MNEDVFQRALLFLWPHEGIDANDPDDRGGRTRYGITRATAERHGFHVEQLTRADAESIYRSEYWRPFDLLSETFPRLAIKAFDIGVNVGTRWAARAVQSAAGARVDGVIGPLTVARIAETGEDQVLEQFRLLCRAHYLAIIDAHPEQEKFRNGWLARADAVVT